MSLTYLPSAFRRPLGDPNPAEVITVTLGDKTFRAGRRTAAHLQATIAVFGDLHVIQPCYNDTVAASAGTHDGDGVLDVSIPDMSWPAAEQALRKLGWAAWWRHTGEWAAESRWHIHMVSLGCPGPVGIYVPGQVEDYYAHRSGLVGHVSDTSWHPPNIDSTVFDYPFWISQEDALTPEDLAKITAAVAAIVDASWAEKPQGSKLTRDQLLKQAQASAKSAAGK